MCRRSITVVPAGARTYMLQRCQLLNAPPRHPSGGYLGAWADQGVLLLNAVLTVEKGRADSHAGQVHSLLPFLHLHLFLFDFIF